ncbi:MAG: hypothetical protein LBR70_07400 [Lactobacillaceae bacterium]|jgi:hypothetical protein|nr:hypothetical protein [Lactobacillaceae bacterium]
MADEADKVENTENPEEWEYEYVEISEGDELPEDSEYEYIEVPVDAPLELEAAGVSADDFDEIEIEEIDIDDFGGEGVNIEKTYVSEDVSMDFNYSLNMAVEELSAVDYGNTKIVTKSGRVEIFQASSAENSLFIGGVDFSKDELKQWKLIIFDEKLVDSPSSEKKQAFPFLKSTVRYAKFVSGDETLEFLGDSNSDNGKFFATDFINISLSDYEGKKIIFNDYVSGMLAGPNASILYFIGVRNILVPRRAVSA